MKVLKLLAAVASRLLAAAAPPNRLVVILQPVLAALAGWVVVLAAKYLPGHPRLDATQLAVLFGLGVSWAALHMLLWLRGWQAHERRQAGGEPPPSGPVVWPSPLKPKP